ncbi:MAG: hypothetical protein EOP84_22960 [Verrucomicrobiaceae bacterium]|nr:MAG: hypothetical protein EOP84_22960 [Verrucomicrobiaceae bacterium]
MPRYSRLTREKRYTIEIVIRDSRSQKEIAATISVSGSTVSRDLRRDGMSRNAYYCCRAERHARSRP